jgi:hypothetical protein
MVRISLILALSCGATAKGFRVGQPRLWCTHYTSAPLRVPVASLASLVTQKFRSPGGGCCQLSRAVVVVVIVVLALG